MFQLLTDLITVFQSVPYIRSIFPAALAPDLCIEQPSKLAGLLGVGELTPCFA